ncbi:RNA polymerase sigma-70 factor [Flammeovirga yaeyamensis]|uniref:RNA polymerase sigma-70 factor n=1 Tax=Flammeovirga yaeyamensis TaxID=367791 RepID=A0AAX1N6M5_9BACT|nr:RNA polymerase sigma-70 factor [Flammeovirga yaeyamensis]MBB3697803.1 RNA polymerase sigma-70 factor (ECF subfamily) [Flammeovirga yaeyamensis]NMF35841.1 RNA polymerase sigma-70 factor [Flammeovirga yaeyamensis]QWG03208.1 RNA polymerase sigma-70 factor [Flammeovirga yaeyamensis]
MNDKTILQDFKDGKAYALKSLFDQYGKRVYGMVYGYFKSKEESEETVQDVFLKLWRYKDNINVEQGVEAYLFRITKNEILNRIRKQKLVTVDIDGTGGEVVSLTETPEDIIDFKMKMEVVAEIIKELPDKAKAVFMKKRMECKTNKEIAEEMGISVKTVENHMTRASSLIKKRLSEEQIIVFMIFWCTNNFF